MIRVLHCILSPLLLFVALPIGIKPASAQTGAGAEKPEDGIIGTIDADGTFRRYPASARNPQGPNAAIDGPDDEHYLPAPNTAHYYNVDGKPGGWTDEKGALAGPAKQKWLAENLNGYENLTWVDVVGRDLYYSRTGDSGRAHLVWQDAPPKPVPVYRMVDGSWVDHTFRSVDASQALRLSATIPADRRTLWHCADGRAAIWTEHGGYGPSAGDTSRAWDYARPVGSPKDASLSTGWLGPKGGRDIHVRDYYRHTASGAVIHAHSYYRAKVSPGARSGRSQGGSPRR